jgi:hypothetical protein
LFRALENGRSTNPGDAAEYWILSLRGMIPQAADHWAMRLRIFNMFTAMF